MGLIDIISVPLALAGGLLLYGPVLLYVWLQGVALWRWRGWWLLAALPPLGVMGPTLLLTAEAYRAESNLWPLMMILAAPLAALWLGIWGWMYRYRGV